MQSLEKKLLANAFFRNVHNDLFIWGLESFDTQSDLKRENHPPSRKQYTLNILY